MELLSSGKLLNILCIYSESTMKMDIKTFNNGSLGSCIDEERSEMRYVV